MKDDNIIEEETEKEYSEEDIQSVKGEKQPKKKKLPRPIKDLEGQFNTSIENIMPITE